MFEKRYYRNKYVCIYNDKLALFELNASRKEAYIIFKAEDNKLDIRLRDLTTNPVRENEYIIPLSIFLMQNGYKDHDFNNMFTRTANIVNELNKEKNKIKVKTKNN